MSNSDPLARVSGHRRFIGVITPSGNTVVERVTIGILAAFPDVSCHFSRTGVVGVTDPFPASYDWDSMLGAATLLSHAKPDMITWSGSKAGSISFDLDRELCTRIESMTGIPATTSTLALIDAFQATGVRRIAIVTPYTSAYHGKVVATFLREGYDCVADACAGLTDNLSYASMPPDDIRAMVRQVARARPDAIVAWCTNFMVAPLAAELEAETGIAAYDSAALAVWHPLALLGYDTSPARAWGQLFNHKLSRGQDTAPS
jgi:maleate isomerase